MNEGTPLTQAERVCDPSCLAFRQTREQRLNAEGIKRQVKIGLLAEQALDSRKGMCLVKNGREVVVDGGCSVTDKVFFRHYRPQQTP